MSTIAPSINTNDAIPAIRSAPESRTAIWTGRILSAVPVFLLLMSAAMKFILPPAAVEGFEHLGWPQRLAFGLGIMEAAVAITYLVPQTAFLGAILITGYLGGAIATHVRIGDPFLTPLGLGVLVWLGLYLRDRRVRALVPWRH